MRTLPLMLGALLLSLSLSGCFSTPVIRPEVVEVERFSYLPVPSELSGDCVADRGRVATNGDLLDRAVAAEAALEICNAHMKAIRELKPPEDK